MSVYMIIYSSKAADDLRVSELDDILSVARTTNAKYSVTGALIYSDGKFMQMLEGDKLVLLFLMDKIKSDSRHYGIEIIAEGEESDRRFPTWSMGYQTGDGVGEVFRQSLPKILSTLSDWYREEVA